MLTIDYAKERLIFQDQIYIEADPSGAKKKTPQKTSHDNNEVGPLLQPNVKNLQPLIYLVQTC